MKVTTKTYNKHILKGFKLVIFSFDLHCFFAVVTFECPLLWLIKLVWCLSFIDQHLSEKNVI